MSSQIVVSHRVVARWLETQGYYDTLLAFRHESTSALHLAEGDLDCHEPNEPRLAALIEDYVLRGLERLAVDPTPLEAELEQLQVRVALPRKAATAVRDLTNILCVQIGHWPRRSWDPVALNFKSELLPCLFTTAVDRTLKIYDRRDKALLDTFSCPSPVLSFAVHPLHPRLILLSTMEGSVRLVDLVTREVKQVLHDHTKYIVGTLFSPDGRFAVTWAYDKSVRIYEVGASDSTLETHDTPTLLDGEVADELASDPGLILLERHVIRTRTNPEAAVFLPSSSHLVYCARDDNILHEVELPRDESDHEEEAWKLTGQNLNENGDSWVSFSILSASIHPHLPILALQTSTENARVLLYPFRSSKRIATLHTGAVQTDFFAPRHAWLPNGSALAVTSEDGIVRIIDVQGRLLCSIGAHGAAAPREDNAPQEGQPLDGVQTERACARRNQDRGSSVIKGVACTDESGCLSVWSCGFDKTVKLLS